MDLIECILNASFIMPIAIISIIALLYIYYLVLMVFFYSSNVYGQHCQIWKMYSPKHFDTHTKKKKKQKKIPEICLGSFL